MKDSLFKLTLILLLFAGFMPSCTDDTNQVDEFKRELNSEEIRNTRFLTKEEAKEIAAQAISSYFKESKTRSFSSDASVTLYQKETRSVADTTFYIIDFEAGGFAIVAADKAAPTTVFAVSDKNHFNLSGNDALQDYMEYAEYLLSKETANGNDSTGIKKVVTIKPVENLPLIEDVGGVKCYAYVYESIHSKPSILKTKWDQWDTNNMYNKYCPEDSEGPLPAGCVPVALAQIMSTHKYPLYHYSNIYDWAQMLQYPYINLLTEAGADDVAHLLRDLGIQAGSKYKRSGTSTSIQGTKNALEAYGYSYKTAEGFHNGIVSNIDKGQPVMLIGYTQEGTGHAWVADGYHEVVDSVSFKRVTDMAPWGYDIRKSTYLNMNWGWGGASDGRYYIGNNKLETNNGTFDRNFMTIHSISKKN